MASGLYIIDLIAVIQMLDGMGVVELGEDLIVVTHLLKTSELVYIWANKTDYNTSEKNLIACCLSNPN